MCQLDQIFYIIHKKIEFNQLIFKYWLSSINSFFIYNYQYQKETMGCQSSGMTVTQTPHQIFKRQQIESSIKTPGLTYTEETGDQLFKEGKFLEAIAVYKKIIQNGYKVDFQIEGLGNSDHMISRYQWWVYRWYNQQRTTGKIKGNVFDALSLCYCTIRITNGEQAEKGIQWYEDMIGTRQCYQLYIGYANLLYNKARFDESIKFYNKILEMKPDIINVYVSIAMVYEYRRIELGKASALANKILQKEPQNMYGHYILARNQTNVDVKIQKLKVVSTKFPDYVRIANDIGIAYGSKSQHQQAIVWYKKCLQIAPEYAAACNNVGVRTEMLKLYKQALPWYFRACQLDHEYKAAHKNASDIFDTLKFTDLQVFEQMEKYPGLDRFMFYYYLGLGYYDKKKVNICINWYTKAYAMNSKNFELLNSMGIAYDEIKDYKNAQKYYLKCIEINPKYHMAYYNMGILTKAQNQVDKTIQWYKKAIEVNPRYNKPYNNLANIYKDKKQYESAIDCYKKAIQANSTYTLAIVNMAVCYLNLEMYQDAFSAFARGKQVLPTDNNNLSEGNKAFLKESLDKFDREGEIWRKTGSIDLKQKEELRSLIKSFQSNFKQLYSSQMSVGVKDQKALKPQILQIVSLIHQDKFELKNIQQIYQLVKHIFHDDEEYFHIIPQLFIQYFWNNSLNSQRPIIEVESELAKIISNLSTKQSKLGLQVTSSQTYSLDIKLKNFTPSDNYSVNLFKDTVYFNNYQILYSEINKVNKLAEQSLPEFTDFVEAVRKRSNGIPYGVNMKLPKRADQQFKVILRILQKMFKKEIDQERVKSIITKIDNHIKKNGNSITLITIVHEIMQVWTKEITLILEERSKKKIATTCGISDLVRGKIMFKTIQDLSKAIDSCDKLCKLKGYQILQLSNRLTKVQTMDVVLKIQINEAVCEFQLAMVQDESKYHFIHSIYEIERSPLGCIFGSYLFMSKGLSYPILANCKDIEARLKTSSKQEDKKIVEAASYIIKALEQKAN